MMMLCWRMIVVVAVAVAEAVAVAVAVAGALGVGPDRHTLKTHSTMVARRWDKSGKSSSGDKGGTWMKRTGARRRERL